MHEYEVTIRLTSDAEPGTGLGGELINSFVPRDHEGNWKLDASHVKGLMRQALNDLVDGLNRRKDTAWNTLADRTFGRGDEKQSGLASVVSLSNFTAISIGKISVVTRTAIGDDGIKQETSLRSVESIPTGTEFKGKLYCNAADGSSQQLAWQLALLSLPAVGAGRNRGSGRCVTEIKSIAANNEIASSFPELLHDLEKSCSGEGGGQAQPSQPNVDSQSMPAVESYRDQSNLVVVRLKFSAKSPICCPEATDKTNVISTGFSIPASAVQGAILHRINASRPDHATALYNNPKFRIWPLQPCGMTGDHGKLLAAIRVSLTHRAAKFFEGNQPEPDYFQDEAICPYSWQETSQGAPLKASDGVLMVAGDSKKRTIKLWKASDMPHVVTAHGVRHDLERDNETGMSRRNLFTVDAMAPLIWQGLVVMPEKAAERLIESLEEQPMVSIGKSRSVRGLGKMSAKIETSTPLEWTTGSNLDRTVLVIQSPIGIPDTIAYKGKSAEEILLDIASSWAKRNGLDAPGLSGKPASLQATWAAMGIRFGWNRSEQGRQSAKRVLLPGSVVCFPKLLDSKKLHLAILDGFYQEDEQGCDPYRQLGYGAVAVHPGKADGFYQLKQAIQKKKSSVQKAIQLVIQIAKNSPLPSASQIRVLQQRLEKSDQADAREYLKNQCLRTARIWSTWKPIEKEMFDLLDKGKHEPEAASRALVVLSNLARRQGENL